MKLSLLIPTIKRHDRLFTLLKFELYAQMLPYSGQIELLIDDHETDPTGMKRNRLLERASGTHLTQIDADDKVSITYVEYLMKAIEADCDCASLKGVYSVDGKIDGIFEHSIRYNEWRTTNNEIKYERYPTPLNLIRSSIAKQFKFPDITWGEDHAWSKQLHESGLLKTEYYVHDIIYYYNKLTK
jgi:hypothetical protein